MKTLSAAKINLTLEILGRRPDGFHELASWMLPVGLYDSIEIERASLPSFSSNVSELKGDQSNLVIRAAEVFNQAASTDSAYAICLEKNIPIGAGLGGGSSNAAATLRSLNALHNFPFDRPGLEELAARLGSDVAFFIGGPAGLCTGRGERSAYRAYTQLVAGRQRGREADTQWGKLRNDLEPAVFPKYLFLGMAKDWLCEQSETLFALMCGSGSTIFAIVRSQAEGETLRGRFRAVFGEQTWSVVCQLNPGLVE